MKKSKICCGPYPPNPHPHTLIYLFGSKYLFHPLAPESPESATSIKTWVTFTKRSLAANKKGKNDATDGANRQFGSHHHHIHARIIIALNYSRTATRHMFVSLRVIEPVVLFYIAIKFANDSLMLK